MKRIFLLTLLFIATRSFSQNIAPFTFGPLVSMTSMSLSSNPGSLDQVAGSGYNIGGFIRVKVLKIYVQGEVSFGSKSSSLIIDSSNISNNVTFKLSGMDLSAIVGLKLFGIREIGNVRIFGGYNLNNYSDINYTVDGNKFATSNVNKNNHGILGGIGMDLWKFTFDIKYVLGLADMTNSSINDVKSRVVNATLAFKII